MARTQNIPVVSPTPSVGCCGGLSDTALTTEQAESMAHAFAALADPVRLRLLSLIATSSAGEVCVCDLVEPLGKSQPTVSHHLKVLREAGLIVGTRRGRWIDYALAEGALERLHAALPDPATVSRQLAVVR